MNREELEERQLEIANRMKNIIWTVCGDYTLEAKPDVEAFLKSKYIALYDGIKQGAFAKYFEKEAKISSDLLLFSTIMISRFLYVLTANREFIHLFSTSRFS